MRDQIFVLFTAAADAGGTDRLTPIVVAGIGAVAAIATTLIVAFARKPDDSKSNGLVEQLREDVRVANRRVERRDKEIDRLQGVCWQHGINPLDGSKVMPP